LQFCGEVGAKAILLGLTWVSDVEVCAGGALGLGRRFVGGPIEASVERLWELAGNQSRYLRACAIEGLVQLGREDAEPLVAVELLAFLEANEPGIPVWPLEQLVSRRPELISEGLKERRRIHRLARRRDASG
jgi:hypothetical protein